MTTSMGGGYDSVELRERHRAAWEQTYHKRPLCECLHPGVCSGIATTRRTSETRREIALCVGCARFWDHLRSGR